MPDYHCCMKYMSFPSQEALEEMRSQRDPTIFTFSFASPGYCLSLSFCPVLLLCKTAAGFWDERHLFGSLQRVTELWKSLVLQSCSFSILYPIWRWWSKGSELREKLKVCLLWSKQQQWQSAVPHKALLRIVLQLMKDHYFCIRKMLQVLINL